MYRISNIKMPLEASEVDILNTTAKKLNISANSLQNLTISKKSTDARNKRDICFVYSVDCNISAKTFNNTDVEKLPSPSKLNFTIKNTGIRPVVVGSGPAGMFAAIALAEAGLKPIVIERGAPVDVRRKDINIFWETGKLNTESNVQFGEGGAGTFSDGKLMSGIKKDIFTAKVMDELYQAGAPKEILYLAKPHIGTDNLRVVVRNIRKKIEELGGEYLFHTKLEDLIIKNGKLQAIVINQQGQIHELAADRLFLCIGHSARDTFTMLNRNKLHMTPKPFSVGFRIEHKQSLINLSQYGSRFADNPLLGPADYKLAVHLPNGRSVYTFCMCPGGSVVAAASEINRLVTNGMSEFARDKTNANAAILVNVTEADFQDKSPLAGIEFQRRLEEKAFITGGGNYHAPAQLIGDFLRNRPSRHFGETIPSYNPKVTMTDLGDLLPIELTASIQTGIKEMAKKLHNFDSYDAVLTAIETRSSSPLRIIRDETMQSNIKGIYPCGEGAGYAGGITSSAADALKVVFSLNE